jgi:hypothetical protein
MDKYKEIMNNWNYDNQLYAYITSEDQSSGMLYRVVW